MPDESPVESPVEVVHRFWEKLIHQWELGEASSLVTACFRFRGALGVSSSGLGAFLDYAHGIRRALPDLRVSFDEVHVDGATVSARLHFTGTHSGPLLGVPATHRVVSYAGAGFFDVEGSRLSRLWLVSDTHDLHRQLTAPRAAPRPRSATAHRPGATGPAGATATGTATATADRPGAPAATAEVAPA